MKLGIIGIVFFLSMPISLAQEILNYDISVKLEKDAAEEEISVLLYNQNYYSLKTFSYSLRADATSIEVYDDKGALDFNITADRGIVIRSKFREPLNPNATTRLAIRFTVPRAVRKAGSEYIFSPVFSLPPGTDEFRLKIRLPEGMGLPRPISEDSGFTDVVPIPDDVSSDGKAIILEWRRINIDGDFAVYVRFTRPYMQNNLYIAALISAIFILALYAKWSRRKHAPMNVSEDESRVLELIRSKQGIAQKEIVENTGFSKAKVSGIVSSLEKKGLIWKKRIGLENRLYLSDEGKKF